MPLDFGASAGSDMAAKRAKAQGVHGEASLRLESLLEAGADIGQALKALREAKNLSLADIAQTTCVRRAYLQALEELNIDQLPSRPFAVGYVKAYAEAQGMWRTAETPDPLTVVWKLSQPAPYILNALASIESQILPKHLYAGTDVLTSSATRKLRNWPSGTNSRTAPVMVS